MSHTAFFYGTLMAPPVLHRVIWGATAAPPTPAHASQLHVRPAVLHGHRRHRVKHADYPAVIPAKTTKSGASCVRGTLVTGLTDGDMWRLDTFEGAEYQRRKVRVRVLLQEEAGGAGRVETEVLPRRRSRGNTNEGGEEIEAETYIWVAGAHRLRPEEWDFEEFVRDKMTRWIGWDAAGADEGFQGRS